MNKRNTGSTKANAPKGQATLLQKAKNVKAFNRSGRVTDEEVELALARAKGEVSYSQAMEAIHGNNSSAPVYAILARSLRAHFQRLSTR